MGLNIYKKIRLVFMGHIYAPNHLHIIICRLHIQIVLLITDSLLITDFSYNYGVYFDYGFHGVTRMIYSGLSVRHQ